MPTAEETIIQAYEWRVTWTKEGWTRTQKKIFQRQGNLQTHLAWLHEKAYRVVAVERRPVGEWHSIP